MIDTEIKYSIHHVAVYIILQSTYTSEVSAFSLRFVVVNLGVNPVNHALKSIFIATLYPKIEV